MGEFKRVMVWCEGACAGEREHIRINAALRKCTVCGFEIHRAEGDMGNRSTRSEVDGIREQLAAGATVQELADITGKPYHTIYSVKRSMEMKGHKFKPVLKNKVVKARPEKEGALLRGVDISEPVETTGTTVPENRNRIPGLVGRLAALHQDVPAVMHKRWIVAMINSRLELIREELIALVK